MDDKILVNFSPALRTPDVKFAQVEAELRSLKAGDEITISKPGQSIFIFARSGEWSLSLESEPERVIPISTNSAVGFERGRAHIWRALRDGELFVSWAPRAVALLQQLQDGFIVIPPAVEEIILVMRLAVDIMAAEMKSGQAYIDSNVMRRCAEITLIQLIRYSRGSMLFSGAPKQIMHDEYLLRAWVAYFAAPKAKWTVKALAEAAGLGRTAFSQRFTRAFGTPPLETLTRLRLQQGQEMLRNSRAPLIEIAFTVGYHSEGAFVRAFHREFGIPPGKYRSRHQNKQSGAAPVLA